MADIATEPKRKFENRVWLHFSLADVRAKKWIDSCERIPARAREILLDSDAHIRLERVDGGFAGVLGDLHFEFDGDPDRLGAIHLYVDADLVVTARLHALPITLITGIFGMNFVGLPWVEESSGFWWVFGIMALTASFPGVLYRRCPPFDSYSIIFR